MSIQLQNGPLRPEEQLRCCEPGCDRHASASDARCILHATRLGPMSREHVDEPLTLLPEEQAPSLRPSEVTEAPEPSGQWSKLAVRTLASVLVTYGSAFSVFLSFWPKSYELVGVGVALMSAVSSALLGWKQLREADDGAQLALGIPLLFIACLPATAVVLAALVLLFAIVS